MNRTPLCRTGPPKRRKGLKRTSARWRWITAQVWRMRQFEVKARDRFMCRRCKAQDNLHVHHKLPRSRGGTHADSNLVTLCFPCHRKIHDHTAPDWRDYIVSKKHA